MTKYDENHLVQGLFIKVPIIFVISFLKAVTRNIIIIYCLSSTYLWLRNLDN